MTDMPLESIMTYLITEKAHTLMVSYFFFTLMLFHYLLE
jgi:hypothetical protein